MTYRILCLLLALGAGGSVAEAQSLPTWAESPTGASPPMGNAQALPAWAEPQSLDRTPGAFERAVPPQNPNTPAPVPLDGGLSLLALAGAGLAIRRLRRSSAVAVALALCALPATAQTTAWINEFHYDNSGADVGEFIEVVLPILADPAAYQLQLYNGGNGARYDSATLDGADCVAGDTVDADGDTVDDFRLYLCTPGSLQNGTPDGIALVGVDPINAAYPLLHFLSYGGPFTGSNSDLEGQTSLDVGVAESPSTPVGSSLALTGAGQAYEAFTWTVDSDDTPGQVNNGQTFAPPPSTTAAYALGSGDDDLAGYRQLGAAVAGIRVHDLAGNNLVQGIDGSGTYPAQYPDAGRHGAGRRRAERVYGLRRRALCRGSQYRDYASGGPGPVLVPFRRDV